MTAGKPTARDLIYRFLDWGPAGGIILILAAAMAMIVANGPYAGLYQDILHNTYLRLGFAEGGALPPVGIEKTVLHWVNDWMVVFFFMVIGLEIKWEITEGVLKSARSALLPLLCAIGGMAVPALIYFLINRDNPGTIAGWAIPCATDIAFALGILSLLGNRVPVALKALLLTAAILDDLGAIIIIALFYTENLETGILLFCLLPIAAMFVMNRIGIWQVAPYLACGTVLWAAVLESGVHATLAGVITAFMIPRHAPDGNESPVKRLEHKLAPWVAFVVMPVFAFANAGVPLAGMGIDSLFQPLTLGIILGLVVGKQAGIFGTIWLCVKTGISPKPEGTSWGQLYGMSVLCGIGFTMSLFIGGLAFPEQPDMQNAVRLGVLAGSLISAVAGYILLRSYSQKA